jgi:adenylate cyclase
MMFQGWSENAVTEAGALLRRAIALDPDCGAPHAYLALLLSLGRMIKLVEDPQAAHDESLAAAERALELDSNSSEVLGYAGCALSDLGYAQRGIPIINKAIELDPSNAQALAALGAAQVVSGELEAGIAELSKAIKISPRDPGLALWATILSIGCGYSSQSQEASRWAELALKSDARFFPGMIALAWSHTVEGRLEEAQTALNNAKQQYPRLDSQYITDLLGAGVLLRMQEAGLSFAERQQPTV